MSLGSLFSSIVKWALIGLAVLFCLPFAYLGTSYVYRLFHTYTHAYRLTVEVETPHGFVKGSSVIQVTFIPDMIDWNPSAAGLTIKAQGEAIFLDLGEGKNLVAVLGFGPTGANIDMVTHLAAYAFHRNKAFWYEQAPSWKGRAELYGGLLPTLVTFKDPSNPDTLQVVRSYELEKIFGPGYRFSNAWIDMTHDRPTQHEIIKKLPWVGNYKEEKIAEHRMRAADYGLGSSGTPGMKFSRKR
ncbi:hypothetical protein dsx2_3334 [Desulfovibrio sp. X2]|uniref:hypothetical protein n=1 Tax=Desulfovibrio sp. X2 TaxID=941449 RepID=UPI000358F1E7|nr:hypothetical protein [Desulfovibrio sp. X2]EPR40784.1 hypothetical protein dsx2_3334 [Desulfovibrio sp. X2]